MKARSIDRKNVVQVSERVIFEVPLGLIDPSPTQPRRRNREGADLVSSIREHGVIEPVWLRSTEGGRYELAFGERRCNASKTAGRATVPAELHDELSNEDVVVLQNIENAARADVTPLEEAESYALLRTRFNLSVEAIAARVHREERHVRKRLALLDLVTIGADALKEGLLTVDAALLFTALKDKEAQREALARAIARAREDEEPIGRRHAAEVVSAFQLRMVGAQWDLADAELVPAAGACTTCPKRTAAQMALFGETTDDDQCTDRRCWREKQDAHWERAKVAAAHRGAVVLEGKAAEKVVFVYGPPAQHLVDLDEVCAQVAYEHVGRAQERLDEAETPEEEAALEKEVERAEREAATMTWRQVLGEGVASQTVARDAKGRVRELLPRKAAFEALRAKGIEPEVRNGAAPRAAPTESPAAVEARLEREAAAAAVPILLAAIAEGAAARKADLRFWRFLVGLLVRVFESWTWHQVLERRGLRVSLEDGEYPERDALLALVGEMKEPELRGLAVELLATDSDGTEEGSMASALGFLEIDAGAIRAAELKRVRAAHQKKLKAAQKDAVAAGAGGGVESASGPPARRKKNGKASRGTTAPVEEAPAPEGSCTGCGCTEADACVSEDTAPCHWAEPGFCSVCKDALDSILHLLDVEGLMTASALEVLLGDAGVVRRRCQGVLERALVAGVVRLRSDDLLEVVWEPRRAAAVQPEAP